MKTQTVTKKLGHFRMHNGRSASEMYFTSRAQDKRHVVVIDKGNGHCTALAIQVEADGFERVAFHAKTAKSLLEFMNGGTK